MAAIAGDAPGAAPAPLLAGKLYRPVPRPELVDRPRLFARLHEGWQSGRALTLIVAPAGYGKSTLAAAWSRALATDHDVAVAWLTLDRADGDPTRFFTYLTAALGEALTGVGEVLPRLLAMLPQPAPETLMAALLTDVAGSLEKEADPPQLLLVLDDYHLIEAPPLHDAVRLLVEHSLPTLHLVLVTREDPPLPLSRWRVRDQVSEIRARALRFTEEEAGGFLAQRAGRSLAPSLVAALTRRTEGWPAGLQLAALALRGARDVDAFVDDFSGSHRYVIDYLVEEVLARLAPETRRFLTQTVVAQRLCAPLCAALLTEPGEDPPAERAVAAAQAQLEALETANLFLIPLDDERRWYRYHQLFADSLRAELDADQRAALHRRAAAWFAAQGKYEEAIDHAAQAGATAELARLVSLAAGPTFQKGSIVPVAAWLAPLPRDHILRDPELGVHWLLSLILTGRSQEAPAAIADLEQHSAAWPEPHQRARLLAIKAWVADITDSPERMALAQEAAAALNEDDPFFRAFIAVPLGHAFLLEGNTAAAVRAYRAGLAFTEQRNTAFARLSLLGNLVLALNIQGRRAEAWATCAQAIAEFSDGKGTLLPPAGTLMLLRGWLHYEANELDAARRDAGQALDLLREAYQETLLSSFEIELVALLVEEDQKPEQALAAVRDGQVRAVRQSYRQAARAAARLEADLHLRHGRPRLAQPWVAENPLFAGRPGGSWPVVAPAQDASYLTYVRYLLAEAIGGGAPHQAETQELLALLADTAAAQGRGRALIAIRLLQAVVAEDPLPALTGALQQAAPNDYRRLFLDECAYPAHGPRLVALLRRGDVRAAAPAFVDELLGALEARMDGQAGPAADRAAGGAAIAAGLPGADGSRVAESLTDQELEVLRYLAAGLSNRDIAEELVITTGTAKWHVHNVYSKLGVHSRVEAILRAQELGLA